MSGHDTSKGGGMDGFTSKLLLDAATSGNDDGKKTASELHKVFKQNQTPAHRIALAQSLYKKLGYDKGTIVTTPGDTGRVGVITGFRDQTSGFYPGNRYPVTVAGVSGEFEQSIFTTKYDEFIDHKDNPEQFLADNKDDVYLRIINPDAIPNIKHVMNEQSKLYHIDNIHTLIHYIGIYESDQLPEHDYVYKYALYCIEKVWRRELQLLQNAFDFIDSKDFDEVENPDVREILIKLFYEMCEWNGTRLHDVARIYDVAKNPIYKMRLKEIIRQRLQELDTNTLYYTTTLLKSTGAEAIGLELLEARMNT